MVGEDLMVKKILYYLGDFIQIISKNIILSIITILLIPCLNYLIKNRKKFYNYFQTVLLYKIKLTAGNSKEEWEENGKKKVFDRFCLVLAHDSKKVIRINPEKIYINDDKFNGKIKLNNIELTIKQPFDWNKSDDLQLIFGVFPCVGSSKRLCSFKGNAHFMEKSLLFKAKNKVSVTVEANKKNIEVGSKREPIVKKYINYCCIVYGTFPLDVKFVPDRYKSEL